MTVRTGGSLWRLALRWILLLALVIYAVAEGEGSSDDAAPDTVAGPENLVVAELKTTRVNPGGAVVVRVDAGTSESGEVEEVEAYVTGQPAELLYRRGEQYVFRIPPEIGLGTATVQLRRGDWRSSHYKLEVRPAKRRKFVRNLIGGLALIVFGLRTLSDGLRRYVGAKLREYLARLTRSSPRSLGLGVVLGGLMQATTSAAGMLVGLLNAKMVGFAAAFTMLLGAQLGAGFTGAVLPLAGGREALLIVALGVAWLLIGSDQRQRGTAELILGIGLLFHGLQLVRVGAATLVDDPEVLAYLRYLDPDTITGLLACGLAGAFLCALLQGPGPVFVVILGMAQSSGLLSLHQCIAILAGTSFGAAIGTFAVASPFGNHGARLARWHLVYGGIATLALLATVPVWALLSDLVLSGDPMKIAYGKKLLYPNVGGHLTLAFVASQVAVTLLALPAARLATRRISGQKNGTRSAKFPVGATSARERLRSVLATHREVLDRCLRLSKVGHRTEASRAETGLQASRQVVEGLLHADRTQGDGDATLHGNEPVAMAALQLQVTLEGMLRVCDRGVERDIKLSPDDHAILARLQELLLEGFSDLDAALEGGNADLEVARAREIRINGAEVDYRRRLVAQLGDETRSQRALFVSELIGELENLGNCLFRLAESLADETDDY